MATTSCPSRSCPAQVGDAGAAFARGASCHLASGGRCCLGPAARYQTWLGRQQAQQQRAAMVQPSLCLFAAAARCWVVFFGIDLTMAIFLAAAG